MLPLLILSLGSDEKKAFYTNLYRRFYRVMTCTAYQVTNGGVSIDDVVQDSLVKLLRHYEKLKGMDTAPLACYISLTVKSAAIDSLRRKRRDSDWCYYSEAETVPDRDTPEQAFIRREERAAKINALNLLPEDQRDLILYKYVLEMPNDELARIFATTEANIRLRLTRTRRRLVKILETQDED